MMICFSVTTHHIFRFKNFPPVLSCWFTNRHSKRQATVKTRDATLLPCSLLKCVFNGLSPFDCRSSLSLPSARLTRVQKSKIGPLIYIKTIATYTSLNVSRFKRSQNMILSNGSFFRNDFFSGLRRP